MKRFTKKFLSVVVALTMIFAMATSASAADAWHSYFGNNDGSFWEGATGTMAKNTAKAFTARMSSVGWGGCWGAQVDQKITLTKGKTYAISFSVKSTKVDKYIYIKMSTGENLAKGFWVKCPAAKTVKVDEVFKAENNANQITFGLGGDAGDRDNGADIDGPVRYKIFDGQKFGFQHKQLAQKDCRGDFSSATDIVVTNYSLGAAATKVNFSAKAKGGKKVKVSLKKAAGVKTYEVKVGTVKKKTTSTSITVKAKKKGKQKVQVRGISANKSYKTKWTTKKVKVK